MTVFSRFWLLLVACSVFAWQQTWGQVVVYQLEFTHEDGFNVDFYNGGYLVAPILGGDGSFLLTAVENGRRVLDVSPGAGSYFLGRDGDRRYNVVAATVGSGTNTARGSYVAFGDVKKDIAIRTPTARIRFRLAERLEGYAVAADDEAGTVRINGSVGTANFSALKLSLDERLTKNYNEKGFTQEQAVEAVTRLLVWRGYARPLEATNPGNGGGDNGDGGGTPATGGGGVINPGGTVNPGLQSPIQGGSNSGSVIGFPQGGGQGSTFNGVGIQDAGGVTR
jgi:hypothetical protein